MDSVADFIERVPSTTGQQKLLSHYERQRQVISDTSRYYPDVRNKGWQLGCGGCFSTVERFELYNRKRNRQYCQCADCAFSMASLCRYFEEGTREAVAVKKMGKEYRDIYCDLLGNESFALSLTKEIPRVIKWIDQGSCGPRTDCIVLELIEGSNLTKHMPTEPQRSPAREAWMLNIAAQLSDTLWRLHLDSNICHLDLSPDNIMLLSDQSNPCDTLRLIDFGFASMCNPGTEMLNIDVSIKDVNPRGATPWYASPEVLRSLKLKAEGARDDEEAVLVNGCLADRWSFACILFEMLTGEKLFEPEDEEGLIPPQAPPQVPKCRQQQWLLYDAIAEAQRDWLETAQEAWEQHIPLNHDILRRVGQCSASPADATHFFMAMLWPKAEDRLVPSHLHVYLKKTYDSLARPAYGKSLEDRVQLAGGPLSLGGMAVLEEEVEHKKQEVLALQLQLQSANGFASEDGFTTEDGSASEECEADYESEVESTEGQSESEADAGCESEASCESEIEPVDESEFKADDESAVQPEDMCELGSCSTVQSEVSYDGDEIQSEGESESEFSSKTEFDSVEDIGSGAGSDAVDEHMSSRSHSAHAAVGTTFNFEVDHQSISAGQGEELNSSHHSMWSISTHNQSTGQLQYMHEPMAGESAVCSSSRQQVSNVDREEAVRHGQATECNQEAAQQAPAVATSQHSKRSCLSGLLPSFKKMKKWSRASIESAVVSPVAAGATTAGEAAASGASPPDSKPLTSGSKLKPVQKLKKMLSGKLSQQASKQVQHTAVPADVTNSAEQQQQQPVPDMAGSNKQHGGKVLGSFKPKKAASKQAVSAGGGSVQEAEPGDLIPAVTQPSGMAQQAEPPALTTTSEQADKPTHRAHTTVKEKLKRLFCLSGQ